MCQAVYYQFTGNAHAGTHVVVPVPEVCLWVWVQFPRIAALEKSLDDEEEEHGHSELSQ